MSWKIDLVKDIFEEGEGSVILQTPISFMNSRDRLIWHGTKDGSFSVSSSSHMEKDKELEVKGQVSTSNSFKGVWNKIWQLHTTSSEKMFLWRACQDSLPIYVNLFKRKVVSDPLRPICTREEESTLHALWNCEAAKDICCLCSKKLHKSSSSHLTMLVFFETLIEVLNADELQEFVVVARQLWLRRNSCIFNNHFMPPNVFLRESRLRLEMLSEKGQPQIHSRDHQLCSSAKVWQVPPLNWFKVNWDGAVDQAKGIIGIGVIIRYDKGQTIATMRQKKTFFPDTQLAESYGALVAAQFARDVGLSQIVMEGDSLQVTKALQEEHEA
ncbi:uncharacterized protein LOC122278468 [Carya illinoinensis]|uniref:uncharacterized protein LOC122278468 n=1 Tax=Carya illinoinensis TaxID=32201 RepID=UPI001C72342B|nr:uncharacterized protein LOC122278468 [Carya illinoinensis]